MIEATTPGWVIVSQLADPNWKARWINLDNSSNTEPEIRPAFRKGVESIGWQCIDVPEPGAGPYAWNMTSTTPDRIADLARCVGRLALGGDAPEL